MSVSVSEAQNADTTFDQLQKESDGSRMQLNHILTARLHLSCATLKASLFCLKKMLLWLQICSFAFVEP